MSLYFVPTQVPAAKVGLWVITSFQCSLIFSRLFIWENICPVNILKIIIWNMRKFKSITLWWKFHLDISWCYQGQFVNRLAFFTTKVLSCELLLSGWPVDKLELVPWGGKVGEHVWDNQFHSVFPPGYTILSIYLPSTPLFIISLSLPFYECCPFLLFIFFFFFLISNISDVKVSESKPVFCLWERTILTFT